MEKGIIEKNDVKDFFATVKSIDCVRKNAIILNEDMKKIHMENLEIAKLNNEDITVLEEIERKIEMYQSIIDFLKN